MKYKEYIIEHDPKTGAYKYYKEHVDDVMYADTVEEAKKDIDLIGKD